MLLTDHFLPVAGGVQRSLRGDADARQRAVVVAALLGMAGLFSLRIESGGALVPLNASIGRMAVCRVADCTVGVVAEPHALMASKAARATVEDHPPAPIVGPALALAIRSIGPFPRAHLAGGVEMQHHGAGVGLQGDAAILRGQQEGGPDG